MRTPRGNRSHSWAVCGLILLHLANCSARYAYEWHQGAFAQGGDLGVPAVESLQAAKTKCDDLQSCCGLTFEGPDKVPPTATKMYLKQDCTDTNTAKEWNHYIRGREITEPWVYFTFVFTFGAFAYAAIGFGYNFLVLGRRGLQGAPNYTFWCEIAGLVKDGVTMTTGLRLADRQLAAHKQTNAEHTSKKVASRESSRHKDKSRKEKGSKNSGSS